MGLRGGGPVPSSSSFQRDWIIDQEIESPTIANRRMPCCCITLHQRSRDTGATFSWLPASGCHAYCSQLRFSRGRAFARQPPASLVIVYDCCGCGSGRQWPCTAEDQHACRECRSRRRLVAWRCEPGMQRATEPTSAHDESAADARCSCRSVCRMDRRARRA